MSKKKLLLEQLGTKMNVFIASSKVPLPPTGWIKAVRMTLGMSLQQLANRLSITRQSVQEIELREKEGSLTIKSLRDAARALDMELVYGFVPKDGTLDALIERKAHELALKIVGRTSNTMKLEDQEVSGKRLKIAVADRTASLKQEMNKALWD